MHLSVPVSESGPNASQNPQEPVSSASETAPPYHDPFVDLTIAEIAPSPAPQMPATNVMQSGVGPPPTSYPSYSGPLGQTPYPHGGGPAGPRPKTIDLAAERRKKLEKVSVGVQLVYWSIAVTMICMMVVFIFGFTPLVGLIPLVNGLGTFAGLALSLIGYVLCVNAPEESKARPFIIAVFCIVALGFLSQFAFIALLLMEYASRSVGGPRSIGIVNSMVVVSTLLQIAQPIAFLLFLKRIAEYVENKEAAKEAMTLVIFFAVLIPAIITLSIVTAVTAGLLPRPGAIAASIIGISLCFVVIIATLARYMIFLQQFSATFESRKTKAW